MAIDRTYFNTLVDDRLSPGFGSTFGKAEIVSALLDPIDAAIAVAGTAGLVNGSAFHNQLQSIADSTFVALNFDSEDFETGTAHSTSSNTSRVTIATTGIYFFFGRITFAANATGYRIAALRANGGAYLEMLKFPTNGAANLLSVQVGRLAALTAGDYVELVAWQNSGGALNTGEVAGNRYNQNDLAWFRVA